MAKLNKLMELNSLEKQNRRNRLEDKLGQQEYSGDIEELFHLLAKTLNTNSEAWLAHNETIQALQDKTLEALTPNNEQQKSFPELQANLSTLNNDRGKTFAVDNDLIVFLLLMDKQTNKQFELKSFDPNSNQFKMNDVDVSLVRDGIKKKGSFYGFAKGFLMFITNKDVTERDIKGDKNKIKQFLKDIGYKQRGDAESNRSKLIRKMLASIGEPISQVISIPNASEDEKNHRDTNDYEQGAVGEEEEEEAEEESDHETDKLL